MSIHLLYPSPILSNPTLPYALSYPILSHPIYPSVILGVISRKQHLHHIDVVHVQVRCRHGVCFEAETFAVHLGPPGCLMLLMCFIRLMYPYVALCAFRSLKVIDPSVSERLPFVSTQPAAQASWLVDMDTVQCLKKLKYMPDSILFVGNASAAAGNRQLDDGVG
jgi:hypothetical protein